MRAECVSEWAVSASRVVSVVSCSGRRNSGVWVGKLLMLLLLEQIMVPVILLPLCVHDGCSKVSTGTLRQGSRVVGLSKLKGRREGRVKQSIRGGGQCRITAIEKCHTFMVQSNKRHKHKEGIKKS